MSKNKVRQKQRNIIMLRAVRL